jgi:hypothetical protein
MLLFLAPRSTRRPTLAPPSATGLCNTRMNLPLPCVRVRSCCNEGFSSAFYTTSFGFRNGWRLQLLLHRQRAPLEHIDNYFQ